ncbi:MAG: hypothetical protein EBR71_02385 [Planctomycetes bacterium]|nr:hypothetical protein [Planctomycetota bacterium]
MQFHTTGIVLAALTVVSAASAQTTQAVEWKVSDGGNGHWYARTIQNFSWPDARDASAACGGHLATVHSEAENAFIIAVDARKYSWLGGYQDRQSAAYAEPAGGWRWVTEEPWSYAWPRGWPDNWEGYEDNLHYSINDSGVVWNDNRASELYPAIVEWDADCNGDGIIDYGQILRGEIADLNSNGVPDICEVSVSGITPPSVPSQGGSIVTIRGTNFQGTPFVKIGGVVATNVVRNSSISLTVTSPALLPGMVPVTVNGFTLPDAIYIRPECGSDLDQNGTVDAGDISIILLDFGPCYQTPLAAPATEVPPLLDAQALPDAPRQR